VNFTLQVHAGALLFALDLRPAEHVATGGGARPAHPCTCTQGMLEVV
jgi:hypothetical protein